MNESDPWVSPRHIHLFDQNMFLSAEINRPFSTRQVLVLPNRQKCEDLIQKSSNRKSEARTVVVRVICSFLLDT